MPKITNHGGATNELAEPESVALVQEPLVLRDPDAAPATPVEPVADDPEADEAETDDAPAEADEPAPAVKAPAKKAPAKKA